MDYRDKKIGIWGFGIVGKSAMRYFQKQNNPIEIIDKRPLTELEQQMLIKHNIPAFQEDALSSFLDRNDYILVSPGIDTRNYQNYNHKMISEIDLFQSSYKKPIIAVTGSVGKTTVTHLLSQLLAPHMKIATGGNIGTGMLDLIEQKQTTYAALLEVSSFQLEQCKTFAPDLAIWTNFYPNHIDRHGSENAYFQAKQNIIWHQKADQKSLLPKSLSASLQMESRYFFSPEKPCTTKNCFYLHNKAIFFEQDELIKVDQLPCISFVENWLIICATLHLLNIPLSPIKKYAEKLTVPEHRLEKVGTFNGIDIYNDSKATTPAATEAAVERLNDRPIILFLGGLGKGIDRSELIKKAKQHVKIIYCFGNERTELYQACAQHNIDCKVFETIDQALHNCLQNAQPGDQLLFSPAGSSFDQFENYQKRGTYFKKIIRQK